MTIVGIERSMSGHPELGDDEWRLFQEHFAIFPWSAVSDEAVGFELGCGTGLWASLVGQRVDRLYCVESNPELAGEAARHLAPLDGCVVRCGDLEQVGIDDGSMDFGYCLGAIQTADDPAELLGRCVRKLKPGAPFLTYLCYALDNRPPWFRALWRGSELLRWGVRRQPAPVRAAMRSAIAAGVYWPLARLGAALDAVGVDVHALPLSTYRGARFDTMRRGVEERFAAPSQARFTAEEVREMLERAGLERVVLSDAPPYWTAVGYRADAAG